MVTANQAHKLVQDMDRELNAAPAVVYACAACLVALCLLAFVGPRQSMWPEVVAQLGQAPYYAVYAEENY